MTARAPVVVTGFGRCGSTMLMRMLRAGGIPFAVGASSYSGEHPSLREAIDSVAPATVTKLLDPMQPAWVLPADAATWVFLWLDRDLVQQSRSWAKFCAAFGVGRPSPMQQLRIRQDWTRDRELVMAGVLPGRVTVFRYEQFLDDPAAAAAEVARALPEYRLDVAAMAGVVHDRSPRCRPDLSFETGVGA